MEKKIRKGLMLLFFIALTMRLFIYLSLTPNPQLDTPGYTELATRLKTLNLTGYNGERTPVYPLILLMGNIDFHRVMIIQLIMGIIISLALYKILMLITKNTILSIIGGLLYTTYLPFLITETQILSESTAIFFMALTFLCFAYIITDKNAKGTNFFYFIALGVFSSLTALTRPLFIFLPIIFFLFLVFFFYRKRSLLHHEALLRILLFTLPIIFMIGGWSYAIFRSTGTFGTTTHLGYGLTNVVGGFIEDAPAKYTQIKEIYIKHRNPLMLESGTHRNTIWRAYPEMQESTGLSYGELSRELKSMCIDVIKESPIKYMKQVFQTWAKYWRRGNIEWLYISNINITVLRWWIFYDIFIYYSFESFFFIFILICMVNKRLRRHIFVNDSQKYLLLLVYLVILFSCILGGMVDVVSPRHAVPPAPFLMSIVLLILWRILQFIRLHSGTIEVEDKNIQ
jgi:4-amino-4-deoxy-L-arabinose transferase-like glycosyltransferase